MKELLAFRVELLPCPDSLALPARWKLERLIEMRIETLLLLRRASC